MGKQMSESAKAAIQERPRKTIAGRAIAAANRESAKIDAASRRAAMRESKRSGGNPWA
jgi:hypothetical protein